MSLAAPAGGTVTAFPAPPRQAADTRPVDLRVDGLAKSFGALEVFSGVSFRVARGESVALVGANGAGKSTLLRVAVGLIPSDGGGIELLGTRIDRARGAEVRAVRRRVGFVFQKHNLVPRISALSNVVQGALGREPGPRRWCQWLAPEATRRRAMDMLELVGLADLALRRADRLSGGQSQRVAIARALMQQPDMIIADEPVASLDPAAGQEVMELFAGLTRAQGVTLLYTTHNIDHALGHSDRVLALRNRALEIDAPADRLDHTSLRAFYD